MEQLTLNVESRTELGKGPSRRLRAAGKLPAVLYGLGKNTAVTVDPKALHKQLMTEGGQNQILTLKGGGLDGKAALVKDYQVDPVSRQLKHVDLLEIDVTKKINVTVKINIVGKSLGVAEGGVLNFIERAIEVRCLPTSIPQHIDIDVTNLKIGDSLHLDEVQLPEGVEKGSQMNSTLIAVVPPTKEEEAAPVLTAAAEPEVITAKKPEEGAEGAPAAGAAPAKEGEAKKDEKKEKK